MNAYLYAMLMIFSNAGIFIVAQLGVFGSRINNFDFFSESVGTIPAIYLAGTAILLAGLLAAGTIKIMGTNMTATTAQGMAYIAFAAIFWASFGFAFLVVAAIPLKSISAIIIPVFTGINIIIFIMALLQMATGGFKTHD